MNKEYTELKEEWGDTYDFPKEDPTFPTAEVFQQDVKNNVIGRIKEYISYYQNEECDEYYEIPEVNRVIKESVERLELLCSLKALNKNPSIDEIASALNIAQEIFEEIEHGNFFLGGNAEAIVCDQYGGSDQGSDYWFVFELTVDGESCGYYRVPGWYQSYYGHELDFNNVFKVKPVEKTITTWKADE